MGSRPTYYFVCFQANLVEDALKKIQSYEGVMGTIVINSEAVPIKTTLSDARTTHYVALLNHLTNRTRWVLKDLDPTNDLTSLRIRSKKHEIIVVPDKEYALIVIQNPMD